MSSLFVGRLPRDDFDDRDLEDLFYKFGKITHCKVKQGTRFGFGFVEFDHPNDAYYAIRETDGLNVDGVRIVVEKARKPKSLECYTCGLIGHTSSTCRRKMALLIFYKDFLTGNNRNYYDYNRSSRDYRSSRYSRSPSYDDYHRRGRSSASRRSNYSRSPSPSTKKSSSHYDNEQQSMDTEE